MSGARSAWATVELGELYYTVLLKDLGCSSNAARICELYEADDRAFKQGYKTVGDEPCRDAPFRFRAIPRAASRCTGGRRRSATSWRMAARSRRN